MVEHFKELNFVVENRGVLISPQAQCKEISNSIKNHEYCISFSAKSGNAVDIQHVIAHCQSQNFCEKSKGLPILQIINVAQLATIQFFSYFQLWYFRW